MKSREFNSFAYEVLLFGAVILIIASLCIPNYLRAKDRASDFEAKSNLHSIQVLCERFNIDNESYPAVLIGGEFLGPVAKEKSRRVGAYIEGYAFTIENDSLDPLIAGGYLQRYPENPFFRNGGEILAEQRRKYDPLNPESKRSEGNYRFGKHGTSMGNVMPDHRYPLYMRSSKAQAKNISSNISYLDSFADFARYSFYDSYRGNEKPYYFPGAFFYKTNGYPYTSHFSGQTIASAKERAAEPVPLDRYIMGVYGRLGRPGLDVLGEVNITFKGDINDEVQSLMSENMAWIKGFDKYGKFNPGCPYRQEYAVYLEGTNWLGYGNPNGIRDGIILELNSGGPIMNDSHQ